ncbi:uncharacterized protein LODBEIA_P56600 [Lodderomyces beijingensis]|uniref:C2H2-type domain-containing protein n=1 Tax=Lodderomyces beijingensis TaxID=1775926 RepID=A0ABP0ZVQ1_9ASCO
MSGIIEAQRAFLETRDTLEESISKRFLRNPKLLPKKLVPKNGSLLGDRKKRYTRRLHILQQQELKFLSEEYNRVSKTAARCFEDDLSLYQQNVESLTEKPSTFDKFDQLIGRIPKPKMDEGEFAKSLRDVYLSFSPSEPSDVKIRVKAKTKEEVTLMKKKCILSSAASHLVAEQKKKEEEQQQSGELGVEVLDLLPFHKLYKDVTGKDVSYVEFTYKFAHFPYADARDASLYLRYLQSLSDYLWKKFCSLYPLEDTDELWRDIEARYASSQNGLAEDTLQPTSDNLYCTACAKSFANENVYMGHLHGKKHQKNEKNAKAAATSPNSEVNGTQKPKSWYEHLISFLAQELKPEILNIEKSVVLSERERMIEQQNSLDLENEFTAVEDSGSSDSEADAESDSDINDAFKNLPLGSDGTPIPLWLYKLQGLHKVYNCEICGNVSYKGRQSFGKHFHGSRHIYGLQCLGIPEENYPLLRNITKIAEARDLWATLKKERKSKEGEAHDAIEVEDKNGNVMKEQDYVELKRQGLI